MSDIDTVKAYYERLVAADFPHSGTVEDANSRLKAVSIRGCHGNSSNQLYFSVTLEKGHIRCIAYECHYCDVILYVTAELICDLVTGLSPGEIAGVGDKQVAEALGGNVRKVVRQARTSLTLLREGLAERVAAEG